MVAVRMASNSVRTNARQRRGNCGTKETESAPDALGIGKKRVETSVQIRAH